MSRFLKAFGVGLSLLWAGAAIAATPQEALDSFAQNLGYRLSIISNKTSPRCPADQPCFSAAIELTTPKVMPSGDWALNLSFTDSARLADNAAFTMEEGNGSFHRLVPKPGMVKAGASYRLELFGRSSFMSPFFLLPNIYVAQDGLRPRVISTLR